MSKLDSLLVLDIYPASEKAIPGISSKKLVAQINKNNGHASYILNNNVTDWIYKNATEFDILITQGAGTISKLNQAIKEQWKLKK